MSYPYMKTFQAKMETWSHQRPQTILTKSKEKTQRINGLKERPFNQTH